MFFFWFWDIFFLVFIYEVRYFCECTLKFNRDKKILQILHLTSNLSTFSPRYLISCLSFFWYSRNQQQKFPERLTSIVPSRFVIISACFSTFIPRFFISCLSFFWLAEINKKFSWKTYFYNFSLLIDFLSQVSYFMLIFLLR